MLGQVGIFPAADGIQQPSPASAVTMATVDQTHRTLTSGNIAERLNPGTTTTSNQSEVEQSDWFAERVDVSSGGDGMGAGWDDHDDGGAVRGGADDDDDDEEQTASTLDRATVVELRRQLRQLVTPDEMRRLETECNIHLDRESEEQTDPASARPEVEFLYPKPAEPEPVELPVPVVTSTSAGSGTVTSEIDGGLMMMTSLSDEKKLFSCPLCPLKGASKVQMDAHVVTHFPFACTQCQYRSRTAGRLERHMKQYHDAAAPGGTSDSTAGDKRRTRSLFKCRSCPFSSHDQSSYYTHVREHIAPERRLGCPACQFVTEFRHHFKYHLMTHLNAKPYRCVHARCRYRGYNASMLKSHLLMHTNDYTHQCSDCSFHTKQTHMWNIHRIQTGHRQKVLNEDGSLSDPTAVVAVSFGDKPSTDRRRQRRKRDNSFNGSSSSSLQQQQDLLNSTASNIDNRLDSFRFWSQEKPFHQIPPIPFLPPPVVHHQQQQQQQPAQFPPGLHAAGFAGWLSWMASTARLWPPASFFAAGCLGPLVNQDVKLASAARLAAEFGVDGMLNGQAAMRLQQQQQFIHPSQMSSMPFNNSLAASFGSDRSSTGFRNPHQSVRADANNERRSAVWSPSESASTDTKFWNNDAGVDFYRLSQHQQSTPRQLQQQTTTSEKMRRHPENATWTPSTFVIENRAAPSSSGNVAASEWVAKQPARPIWTPSMCGGPSAPPPPLIRNCVVDAAAGSAGKRKRAATSVEVQPMDLSCRRSARCGDEMNGNGADEDEDADEPRSKVSRYSIEGRAVSDVDRMQPPSWHEVIGGIKFELDNEDEYGSGAVAQSSIIQPHPASSVVKETSRHGIVAEEAIRSSIARDVLATETNRLPGESALKTAGNEENGSQDADGRDTIIAETTKTVEETASEAALSSDGKKPKELTPTMIDSLANLKNFVPRRLDADFLGGGLHRLEDVDQDEAASAAGAAATPQREHDASTGTIETNASGSSGRTEGTAAYWRQTRAVGAGGGDGGEMDGGSSGNCSISSGCSNISVDMMIVDAPSPGAEQEAAAATDEVGSGGKREIVSGGGGGGGHACRWCEIEYPNETMYALHAAYHGPDADPYCCGKCGRRSVDQFEFYKHISYFPHP